jgi:uncharacterized membrane protein
MTNSYPAAQAENYSTGRTHITVLLLLCLVFGGAMFGFFYAWVCSTVWGLDQLEPEIAIRAMQAMNASVRNGVFALAFFGTPIVLCATFIAALLSRQRLVTLTLLAALCLYVGGVIALTGSINVPLNDFLATVTFPQDVATLTKIWSDYSAQWQSANQMRAAAAGVSLLLVGIALALNNTAGRRR